MDAYPPDYIFHNLPLVILSGLGSADNRPQHGSIASYPLLDEKGLRITSALLPVTGSSAEQLLRTFLEADASKGCWNGRSDREKTGTMGFRVKEVGRVGQKVPVFQ